MWTPSYLSLKLKKNSFQTDTPSKPFETAGSQATSTKIVVKEVNGQLYEYEYLYYEYDPATETTTSDSLDAVPDVEDVQKPPEFQENVEKARSIEAPQSGSLVPLNTALSDDRKTLPPLEEIEDQRPLVIQQATPAPQRNDGLKFEFFPPVQQIDVESSSSRPGVDTAKDFFSGVNVPEERLPESPRFPPRFEEVDAEGILDGFFPPPHEFKSQEVTTTTAKSTSESIFPSSFAPPPEHLLPESFSFPPVEEPETEKVETPPLLNLDFPPPLQKQDVSLRTTVLWGITP